MTRINIKLAKVHNSYTKFKRRKISISVHGVALSTPAIISGLILSVHQTDTIEDLS